EAVTLTGWEVVEAAVSITRCVVITRSLKQRTDCGSVAGRDQPLSAEPDAMPIVTLGLAACSMVADSRRVADVQGHGLRPGRLSPGTHRLRRALAWRSPPLE